MIVMMTYQAKYWNLHTTQMFRTVETDVYKHTLPN